MKTRMETAPDRRSRTMSFTLIELLIVISIIAILAGMLLPALSAARARVKDTNCLARLKQLASCYQSYSDHNDGWVLPPQHREGSSSNCWDDIIAQELGYPYMERCRAYFTCPREPRKVKTSVPFFRYSHYIVNAQAVGAGFIQTTTGFPKARKEGNFHSPSKVAIILDSGAKCSPGTLWAGNEIGWRHGSGSIWFTENDNYVKYIGGNTANSSFLDGHAVQVTKKDIPDYLGLRKGVTADYP